MDIFKKRNISKIFSILIAILSILFVIWKKFWNEEIPNLVKNLEEINTNDFDFIVVGAGTSGSVVASLLSEKSNYSVLLIEAGHTFNLLTSSVPLLATLLQKSESDWNLLTIPQKYSSRSIYNQKQCLPRGKGLGGSSQMNFMLHFSGYKKDFEIWQQQGLTNWDYEIIQKHCQEDDETLKSNNQEKTKKIKLSDKLDIWKMPANYSKLSEAFNNARKEFAGENLSFDLTEYTIKNGLRSNVYQKFLRPAFYADNLKILTKAHVEKVKFDEQKNVKAIRVHIINGKNIKIIDVPVKKEVIISAGAYLTPGILQRSGIGEKSLLNKFDIKIIHESPNVGHNLFDHMTFPLFVSIEAEATATIDKILSFKELWKYLTTGEGYFSSIGVIGIITSLNKSFGINIFGTGSVDERFLMTISNFKKESFRSIFPFYYNTSQEGFVLLTSCYQLRSRGAVEINGTNPFEPPLINPNYLKEQYDIDCIIEGVKTAVQIVQSKSFQDLKPKIHWPKMNECLKYGPTDQDFLTNQPSKEYLECLIREIALNSHHPGGTCRMGLSETNDDSTAPLDQYLRVKGVNGLRVVDASVLPTPISGTPNSILIAMAKIAVNFILG